MGLFDKLFKKKEEVPVQEEVPEMFQNRFYQDFNLTEKNVKIEFEEEEKVIKHYCFLQEKDGKIQFGGELFTLIFEVTSRSKVYKELKPFVGQEAWYLILRKRKGDYGLYYRATIKYKISKEEGEEILANWNKA